MLNSNYNQIFQCSRIVSVQMPPSQFVKRPLQRQVLQVTFLHRCPRILLCFGGVDAPVKHQTVIMEAEKGIFAGNIEGFMFVRKDEKPLGRHPLPIVPFRLCDQPHQRYTLGRRRLADDAWLPVLVNIKRPRLSLLLRSRRHRRAMRCPLSTEPPRQETRLLSNVIFTPPRNVAGRSACAWRRRRARLLGVSLVKRPVSLDDERPELLCNVVELHHHTNSASVLQVLARRVRLACNQQARAIRRPSIDVSMPPEPNPVVGVGFCPWRKLADVK